MSAIVAPDPTDLLRDRLLDAAELLGVHPSGAVMAQLLRTSPVTLHAIAAGRATTGGATRLPLDQLALLSLFAALVRARLADPDPDVFAIRLAAWRTWMATPSLAGTSGLERPLDRLGDAGAVADAIRELVGVPEPSRSGPAIRFVSLLRPAARSAPAR